MKPKLKTNFFIILVLFSSLYLPNCSASTWDYIKGGIDWGSDCQKGDQSPIDIAAPFTFKSIFLILT
jgi:hypothetical protein